MRGSSVKNQFQTHHCAGPGRCLSRDGYGQVQLMPAHCWPFMCPDRALSVRGCWPRWLFTGPWSAKQTNTRARDTRITTVCGMTHRRRAEPCLMDLIWTQYFFKTSYSGYLCWQYSFKVTNHIAAFGHSRLSIRISYSLPHMAKWRICIA